MHMVWCVQRLAPSDSNTQAHTCVVLHNKLSPSLWYYQVTHTTHSNTQAHTYVVLYEELAPALSCQQMDGTLSQTRRGKTAPPHRGQLLTDKTGHNPTPQSIPTLDTLAAGPPSHLPTTGHNPTPQSIPTLDTLAANPPPTCAEKVLRCRLSEIGRAHV